MLNAVQSTWTPARHEGAKAELLALKQKEVVPVVASALRTWMKGSRVALACPAAYPSWEAYLESFARRGGVIEACPSYITGSPSVNLFVEPTGDCG